jgi:hypothetical protein
MVPPKDPPVHYTLLIRLPFPRGAFVDPPQVEWDEDKDKKLWRLIAAKPGSSGQGIDWAAQADDFGVSEAFLMQQAAWLYERQLRNVKATVRVRASNAGTPVPGAAASSLQQHAVTSVAMKRLGSGGAQGSPLTNLPVETGHKLTQDDFCRIACSLITLHPLSARLSCP